MIREAGAADAAALAGIYNHFIENTVITFDETPVSAADMAAKIAGVVPLPFLVFEEGGAILGYAYAGPWKPRSAYRFSVETTVYVKPGAEGAGRGRALMTALLERLSAAGVHVALAGIALPNPASVALHESLGFKKAAHFAEIGWKFDRRIDVGYWQATGF